jgi:hypothetical protein
MLTRSKARCRPLLGRFAPCAAAAEAPKVYRDIAKVYREGLSRTTAAFAIMHVAFIP